MFLFQNTGFITGILIDQILTDFIICLKKKWSIFSSSNLQLFWPDSIHEYYEYFSSELEILPAVVPLILLYTLSCKNFFFFF